MNPQNLAITGSAVRASLGEWDLHPYLQNIGCPVLLAYGGASVFPEEAIGRMHEGIRGSVLVRIEGTSHFPSIESPKAFGAAARAFLASRYPAR